MNAVLFLSRKKVPKALHFRDYEFKNVTSSSPIQTITVGSGISPDQP